MFAKKTEKNDSINKIEFMTIHMVDGSSFDVLCDNVDRGVYSSDNSMIAYAVQNADLRGEDGHIDHARFISYKGEIELRGAAEYRVFLNPAHIVSVSGSYLLQ